nr:hypothetical protein [Tanacetum cinerariifolium]
MIRDQLKIKRSKLEDEPFVKDDKLSKKVKTITCQSCSNIRLIKATCKGKESAVGHDGLGGSSVVQVPNAYGSGVSDVICLSVAGGQPGRARVGVGVQNSSPYRWTKRRVQAQRLSLQKRTPTQPASQPSSHSQL